MDTLLQDLRYACRTLRRSRAFTATALAVLALGIGATTTIYTVVRGVALKPLPFERPERLMFIGEVSAAGRPEPVAPANVLDLARQSRAFDQMAMHRGARFILTGRSVPESIVGANVSSTFFSVLRVQPQRGRAFLPEDEQGGARRAMLSHASWIRHFSQDPAIVGRTITLDGAAHNVIGILPAGFSLWDTDVWVAGFDRALLENREARNMGAIGRLADGMSVEQARAELDTIGRRLALEYPATNAGWTFRAVPLQQAWLGVYRPTSLILLGAVAMVLLIACGNLANLLLQRALARDREVSIRVALGARPVRIVRQMLTESVLLGVLGGAAGVLAAAWSLGFVVALIPANTLTQIPGGAGAIHLDLHTLGVVLVVSVGTGLLFGLAPAARMIRADARGTLRTTARSASAGRQSSFWRRALVAAQVTLSAILLIGATLMIQSFWRLQELPRGYDADNALSFWLSLPQAQYPEPGQREAFFTTVVERMRALPGVTRVGGMTLLSGRGRPFTVDGQAIGSRDAAPTAVYRVATPDYLATIGIPLLRGRHFSAADRENAPGAAIVNQTLARRAWGNQDPIGRRLQLRGPPVDEWLTVVGVAGDVKESLDPRYPLRLDPQPTIYRPLAQEPVSAMTLILRTGPDPLALAMDVRRQVAGVDSTIPVMMLQSVRQGLAASIATPRFNTILLLGFAGLALLIAAVGLYGVIAYSVDQRTREMGIRLALGAAPAQLLRAIVREGLTLTLAGVTVGVVGAFGAVRLIAHNLYGIQTTDPVAFTIVPCVLLVVAAVASYLPARRAAGVDPLNALRDE
jgi:putative ABC transport system permease protein